uniref:Uncharacterized protein n=1 Tax=Chrysotila carterae TaxID=13221 RepID=A0A7S4C090_CHRCT
MPAVFSVVAVITRRRKGIKKFDNFFGPGSACVAQRLHRIVVLALCILFVHKGFSALINGDIVPPHAEGEYPRVWRKCALRADTVVGTPRCSPVARKASAAYRVCRPPNKAGSRKHASQLGRRPCDKR